MCFQKKQMFSGGKIEDAGNLVWKALIIVSATQLPAPLQGALVESSFSRLGLKTQAIFRCRSAAFNGRNDDQGQLLQDGRYSAFPRERFHLLQADCR